MLYAGSSDDFGGRRIFCVRHGEHWSDQSCWQQDLEQRLERTDVKVSQSIPGTSDDSFLFASSRVRIFSSVVRGWPATLSFPPGHMLSRRRPI